LGLVDWLVLEETSCFPGKHGGFPMNKKYIVRLSEEERATCRAAIKKLKGSSQKVRRAHLLLKSDADGPAWTDAQIAGCGKGDILLIDRLGSLQ